MEEKSVNRLEDLRWKVLEQGKKSKDRLKVSLKCVLRAPEGILKVQMLEDFKRQYKFYDALAMWIGQRQFWSDKENAFLLSLAEEYLARKDLNHKNNQLRALQIAKCLFENEGYNTQYLEDLMDLLKGYQQECRKDAKGK